MIFIGIKRISDKIDFDIFVIFAFEKVEEIPGSELESKYIFLSKNKWNNSKDGSKVVGYGKHYSHEEFEQNKESYFPDGVLSFKVNIFAHNHEVLGFDGTNPSHMSKVFEDIFTHMKHSDVTIVTSDETLRAHSVILSARSKVFDNELTEVKELNAKEFSSKIMKMILKFIYTNKLDEIDYIDKHEIYELFHAAKKFGIVKDFLNVNAEKIQGKLKNPIELICLFVEFGQVPDEILNSSALVISE
jgi:actin-related protein